MWEGDGLFSYARSLDCVDGNVSTLAWQPARERWVWIRRALVKYLSNFSCSRQVVRSFEHTNFQPFHSIVSHPSRRWASHSPALTIHTIRREWTLVENEKPKICKKYHIPCSCCCSVAWELTESLPLTRAAQNELNLKSLKREIQQLLLAGEESKSFTEKRFKIVLELRSQVDLYEKFITSREAYTVAIGCRSLKILYFTSTQSLINFSNFPSSILILLVLLSSLFLRSRSCPSRCCFGRNFIISREVALVYSRRSRVGGGRGAD